MSIPHILVRDIRKEKDGISYGTSHHIEEVVFAYNIDREDLWLTLDTGYKMRIEIKSIAEVR